MGNDAIVTRARGRVNVTVNVGGKGRAKTSNNFVPVAEPKDDFVPLPKQRPSDPNLQYLQGSAIQQYGKGLVGSIVPTGSPAAKAAGMRETNVYGAEIYREPEFGGPTVIITGGRSALQEQVTFAHEYGHAAAEEVLGRAGYKQEDFDIEEARARMQDVQNLRKIPRDKWTPEIEKEERDALIYLGIVAKRAGRDVGAIVEDAVKKDEEIARRIQERTGKPTISELSGLTARQPTPEEQAPKPDGQRGDE